MITITKNYLYGIAAMYFAIGFSACVLIWQGYTLYQVNGL